MNSLNMGYRSIIFGTSGGIGSALLKELQMDPNAGDIIAIDRQREPDFDLTSEAFMRALAEELKRDGQPLGMILDATGALEIDGVGPEKAFKVLDPEAMARQFTVNAIGPALIIKHFAPLLPRSGKSIIASLSARVGSIGDNRLGGWISYRSAKAALNQIIRCASIEIARRHPEAVVVGLHPGTVATDLSQKFAGDRTVFTPDYAAQKLLQVLDYLQPQDSGNLYAYDGQRIEW